MRRVLPGAAIALLLASSALAQAPAPTSIPVSSLASAVAAAIKQSGFAGLNVGNALVGATPLTTIASQAAAAATQSSLAAVQTTANAALPTASLPTTPFLATLGNVARTMADRASDRINISEYKVTTLAQATALGLTAIDPDDTLSISRAYAVAQNQMTAGADPIIDFPRSITVSAMPQLKVPFGRNPSFASAPRGGTMITLTGAGNGIDVAVQPATSAQLAAGGAALQISSIGIGDFKINKAPGAPIGGYAVNTVGLPNASSPGGAYGSKIGMINCRGSGFGGSTANPWLGCVHVQDQNYSDIDGVDYIYTGPANGEMASGTGVIYETTNSTNHANFSVDHILRNITMNSGFAGVRSIGHVEGIHVMSGTIVGSVYGVYSPAYVYTAASGSTAAILAGVDAIYVSQTHMNTVLRGVYAEQTGNVQTDSTDYFDSPSNGANSALATDAVLPADTAVLNPSNNLNGYSWVGVDDINGNFLAVVGSSFQGTGAGYANAVRYDVAALQGVAAPTSMGGGVIANIEADSVNGYAIHVGSAIVKTKVDNNNFTNTAGLDNQSAVVEHSGNTSDGTVVDTGFINGQLAVAGSVKPTGSLYVPYGYQALGGTNRAVIDFRSAGYTATGAGNARIELDTTYPGSATGTNDGQMDLDAAQVNTNYLAVLQGLTAKALTVSGASTLNGALTVNANTVLAYGYQAVGGTNRGVIDFRSAGYTGTGGNARIELDTTNYGSATGIDDAQLDLDAAQVNLNVLNAIKSVTTPSLTVAAGGSATLNSALAVNANAIMGYGYVAVGGTNRGVIDLRSAGYTGAAGNARIELDSTNYGSATGTNDGQIRFDAAQVNMGALYVTGNLTVPAGYTTAIDTLIFDPAGAGPTHNTSACAKGQTAWDATYEYRCIATNSWQRWARNASDTW